MFLSNPRTGVNSTGVNMSWLNPASVTLPTIGQFGDFERPTFRTPGFNKWDMTLFKEFPLSEKSRLQFRLAAFDIFNRAQLDAPQSSASFDWNLPLGATSLSQGSASLANPESFGIITDKRGHREVCEKGLAFHCLISALLGPSLFFGESAVEFAPVLCRKVFAASGVSTHACETLPSSFFFASMTF